MSYHKTGYGSSEIFLHNFKSDRQVANYVRNLHQHCENVTEIVFCNTESFVDQDGNLRDLFNRPSPNNWDPLLRELETRQNLEKIVIQCLPVRPALKTLLRHRILAALQRNPHLQSLVLMDIAFSSDFAERVASCFLNYTTSGAQHGTSAAGPPAAANRAGVADLTLIRCRAVNRDAVRSIATTFRRNNKTNQVETLHLLNGGLEVRGPILQSLAAASTCNSNSTSCRLTKLVFEANCRSDGRSEETAQALQQCLESDACTVQTLELRCITLNRRSGSSHILSGLCRNTTLSELAFGHCSFSQATLYQGHYPRLDEEDDLQEHAQQLADCLRALPANYAKLRFSMCSDFFDYPVFSEALAEVIARPKSSLRSLEFEVSVNHDAEPIPLTAYQALMTAVTKSNHVERLHMKNLNGSSNHYQTLKNSIPMFKSVKELIVTILYPVARQDEELLLDAFKNNYSLQRVEFTYAVSPGTNCFSEKDQTCLQFFLDRNRKLAQWTANPTLVPPELWSYALNLALKAGLNSFYQSLMALLERGVKLRQQSRKRKHPQQESDLK